jgi:hypothetical protein
MSEWVAVAFHGLGAFALGLVIWSSWTDRKGALVSTVNVMLAIAGVINLGVGIFYMARADAVLGGAAVTAGLILLLASTIDRFESLKGLGMEAKTRELRRTLDEADVIMSKMKQLAKLTCSNLVKLNTRPGPEDSATRPFELRQQVRQVKEILSRLEFDHSEVRAVLIPWMRVSAMDAARAVLMRHHARLGPMFDEINSAINKYGYPGPPDNPDFVRQLRERDELQVYRSVLQPGYVGQGGPSLHRQLSPKDAAAILRDAPNYQPDTVPAQLREAFREDIERWANEIEYLDEQLDFRDPDMWTEALKRAETLSTMSRRSA